MIYMPGLPLWSGLAIAFAARNTAAYFTKWYPQYRKAKYGAPPANALPGTTKITSNRNSHPAESKTMKNVFARLAADFFSTILFLAIYLTTDNVMLATGVRSPARWRQVIYSRVKGKELGYMTWASLALVIVLGGATLLTHDPRFVLAKPAIGHFAIGAIMLKRGWMLRYMPPIVTETIPEYVTFAGYAWAALMFVLGAGTIAVAATGDIKLWAFYVSVVLIGAKSRPLPCNMSRFASSSPAGSAPPPAPEIRGKSTHDLGLGREMRYTAAEPAISQNHSGLREETSGRQRWPWTETGISP